MSKNTLVIIFAQTRSWEKTFHSFEKTVLCHHNFDLACCISESDPPSEFEKRSKYVMKAPEYDDFGIGVENEAEELGYSKDEWKKIFQLKDQFLGGIGESGHPGSAGILLFYRLFLLRKLKELQIENNYEWFIITRSDYIHLSIHPNTNDLNNNFIYIPDGEQYGGFTDRHAIIPKKYLYNYLSVMIPFIVNPDKCIASMKHKQN